MTIINGLIFSQPISGKYITVSTYIGESYGVKSERYVEIKKDGKLLAKAKTIWCLLHKTTMKPVKFPPEIMSILNLNKA